MGEPCVAQVHPSFYRIQELVAHEDKQIVIVAAYNLTDKAIEWLHAELRSQ